jgi:hypothetical protein
MVDTRSVKKVNSNLQAEQQRLLDTIFLIRGSGEVAPAYCWLTASTVTKGGKTYEYARLVIEKPGSKPKISSLGRLGSERHRQWKTAIARRDAIVELEQQLKILQGLMDRQVASWGEIEPLLSIAEDS